MSSETAGTKWLLRKVVGNLTPAQVLALALKPRNKFNARKVEAYGHTFDSGLEYERYLVLRDCEARGEISALEVHPVVELQARTRDFAGRNVAPITWKLDFAYRDRSGKYYREDVKSKATKTQAYGLKRRMLLAQDKLCGFREVTNPGMAPGAEW